MRASAASKFATPSTHKPSKNCGQRPQATRPSPSSEAPKFGSVEEALRDAEAELARDPENTDLQLILAERRVESDLLKPARQGFKAVLAKNPRSARALVGLATVYLDEGDRDEALCALKQAWAIEPDNWIIRKQIWAVEHSEQLYPPINPQRQREQIKKEKAAEGP